jgi:hypothetical protein
VRNLRSTIPCPEHIIVLNCYGRGGSGIVWRMIGSSPDVIMTDREWHVGVFGGAKILRKVALRAFGSLDIDSFEPLRWYVSKKTVEMQRPADLANKTGARLCVIKLMDHHILFSEMIRRSFRQATFVNLTRHPYGQCESLIRSGLSLEVASEWYAEVARMMARRAESGALTLRFEDIVTQPMLACDKLYEALGIRWPADGKFDFKIKAYGERRTEGISVRDREFIRIAAEEFERWIDPTVLRGERDRLSDHERRVIWSLTGEMASHFGYDQSGSC